MAQGAKVAVTLDTKPAEKKLRELGKQGEATARRVSGKASGGPGDGSLGQGFGVGVGFGLGKKVAGAVGVFGAIGAVTGEYFSGFSAQAAGLIGSPEALARKGAREETVATFASQAGRTGDTSGARQFYNAVLQAKHLPQQIGANKLHAALGSGRGDSPDGKNHLDRMFNGIISEISSGFDNLIRWLSG